MQLLPPLDPYPKAPASGTVPRVQPKFRNFAVFSEGNAMYIHFPLHMPETHRDPTLETAATFPPDLRSDPSRIPFRNPMEAPAPRAQASQQSA